MRSGSQPDPDGPRFGRRGKGRAARKSKRKWTPEPGFDRAAPPPPREHSQFYDDSGQNPAPPQPPPPRQTTRWMPVDRAGGYGQEPHGAAAGGATADDAPTGTIPAGASPPPPRGARQYPPSDFDRTQPVRREQPAPPPRQDRPFTGDYERYDTGGNYPNRPPGSPEGRADDRTQQAANHLEGDAATAGTVPKLPKKITVTRVAALRSRQLTSQAVDAFHRAHRADGADKSGLTSLSFSVMLNYASDAAMAIALANTLFFAASSGESKGKVALYLLITIAPFALVAPVIGPALDKIQRGRRLAMSVSSAGQALMCVVMALNFDTWLLYPAALGKMVLSKSFMVLKSSVTPRVVPPEITLSKTNARLTVFGLAAGGVFGAVASGFNALFGAAGALWFTAVICVVGTWQAMRIPSWVEVTEGEVPASLSSKSEKKKRQPMGRHVVVSLWGNGTVRVLTGFLMMFAAFAIKSQAEQNGQTPFAQLLLLGVIGAAAGIGGFVGNALGSRLQFGKPDQVVIGCVAATLGATVLGAAISGITTAAIVGLVGATGSALAKISLDAVIQQDLPEESRASAFGRSETVLQMAWCFGGAVGLLLPPTYWIGFLVVSVLLALGLVQTILVRRGTSLLPGVGGDRPLRPEAPQTVPPRHSPEGPATYHNHSGS